MAPGESLGESHARGCCDYADEHDSREARNRRPDQARSSARSIAPGEPISLSPPPRPVIPPPPWSEHYTGEPEAEPPTSPRPRIDEVKASRAHPRGTPNAACLRAAVRSPPR
jgi:hypothetical protein